MTEKMYKVISKESKSGLSRIGKPYVFNYLILDFNGKPARIQAPRDMDINVNDRVVLGLATKKGFGCAELAAVVAEVIPAEATKGE